MGKRESTACLLSGRVPLNLGFSVAGAPRRQMKQTSDPSFQSECESSLDSESSGDSCMSQASTAKPNEAPRSECNAPSSPVEGESIVHCPVFG